MMLKKFLLVLCGFIPALFISGVLRADETSTDAADSGQPSYRQLLEKLYFSKTPAETPDIELKKRDREPQSTLPPRRPSQEPKVESKRKEGRLESFESPYSENKEKKKRHHDDDDDDDDDDPLDFACSCASEINLLDLLFSTDDETDENLSAVAVVAPEPADALPAAEPQTCLTEMPAASSGYSLHEDEDNGEELAIASHLEASFISIDETLWAYNYQLEWRARLINIELGLTQFVEDIGNRTDHLDFGKIIISTNILRNSKNRDFSFDIGLGAASLSGEQDHYGAALELAAKAFVRPKYSVSLTGTYSHIDSQNTFELDAKLGIFLRHLQITGGYHSLISENDSLHGPEVGLSVWFW